MPLEKPRPKTPKRVMEKKRRARINDSLTELKNLVLHALNRNSPRHSKLEKADILEMTVKYLRNVHGRHIAAAKTTVTPEPDVLSQYRSGFAECMHEVSNFFEGADGNTNVKLQLLDHLSRSCGTPQSPPTVIKRSLSIPTGSYQLNPNDANLTPQSSLPIFRIPSTTNSSSSHSAPPTLLTTDSVQSAMQVNNNPPTVMNIQFPPLSRIPVPVPISLPAPPIQSPPQPPLLQPKGMAVRLEGGGTSGEKRHVQDYTTNGDQDDSQRSTLENSQLVPVLGDMSTGGDVTIILPQASLPGGKVPTHLIPVYQPNNPYVSNVLATVASTYNPGPSSTQNATPDILSTLPKLDLNNTGPQAGTITPVTLLTRSAYLTANIGQTSPVFSPQGLGTPFTITLPVQARIVPNLIPIQAATAVSAPVISAGNCSRSFSLPLRMANPVQNMDDNGFMWRPW